MTSCGCQLEQTLSVPSGGLSSASLLALANADAPQRVPLAVRAPHEVMSELFGVPVPLSPWCSDGGLQYTMRWRHGGGRGHLPAMQGHLVTVCHAGSGMVILSSDGRRMAGQLRRGVVTVLPEGTHGTVDVTGEAECSQVIVPASLFRGCAAQAGLDEDTKLTHRMTVLDPVLFHLVDMLTAETHDDAPGERFREQCAALICTHLLRKHSSASAQDPQASTAGLAAWQLRRIKEYMQENLHAPITLHHIASQVALSRHYLCTAFRNATGFTPHEYLTSIRIERAKQLLESSNLTVCDISATVGYGTASAFTASFRRATGMTPRAYRANR